MSPLWSADGTARICQHRLQAGQSAGTLERVDWNAELVRGDLGKAVQQLKREPGNGLFTGA